MLKWNYQSTASFDKAAKWYDKKRDKELAAVLIGLHFFLDTLNKIDNITKITGRYIHREPQGIIAIDQTKGQGKGRLEETRLYFYPDSNNKLLHLIFIGNKKSQREDIKLCKEVLKDLKKSCF